MEAADGDAVVVIDCDLQDPPELIADMVARWRRGLRGRLRPAPHARRRDAGQARRLGGRLPRDQAHLRRRDPRQHGRLPADEPARGRQRGRAARGARLPARARRARRLPPDRRCSTTATRARPATGKYNRFFGSLVIGMNGIVGFSRYPLHLISMRRRDPVGVLGAARRSSTSVHEDRRLPVPDRQPDDRDPDLLLQRHPAAEPRA